MTQVLSWIAVLGLLSVLRAAPASFAPDEEVNGPALNGNWIGHQGPSLNGSPLQLLAPKSGGFAVEGVELADGTALDR